MSILSNQWIQIQRKKNKLSEQIREGYFELYKETFYFSEDLKEIKDEQLGCWIKEIHLSQNRGRMGPKTSAPFKRGAHPHFERHIESEKIVQEENLLHSSRLQEAPIDYYKSISWRVKKVMGGWSHLPHRTSAQNLQSEKLLLFKRSFHFKRSALGSRASEFQGSGFPRKIGVGEKRRTISMFLRWMMNGFKWGYSFTLQG